MVSHFAFPALKQHFEQLYIGMTQHALWTEPLPPVADTMGDLPNERISVDDQHDQLRPESTGRSKELP